MVEKKEQIKLSYQAPISITEMMSDLGIKTRIGKLPSEESLKRDNYYINSQINQLKEQIKELENKLNNNHKILKNYPKYLEDQKENRQLGEEVFDLFTKSYPFIEMMLERKKTLDKAKSIK